VYAIATNDVWAVGYGGAVIHWNGSTWEDKSSGSADLRAVWASSANDVWAVGIGSIQHLAH
jgi:hypothetical protein